MGFGFSGWRGKVRALWRSESWDNGAEVIDECFTGAGEEEEATREEPHGAVGEEIVGFVVEEPALLFAEAGFLFLFLQEQ